jgi:hypothetical protein
MSDWRNFVPQWWGGLVRPGRAGALVLDTPPRPGFNTFLLAGIFALYLVYGFGMGLFKGGLPGLVSGAKLPILYLGSVLICFPPLYVLNCLIGPRLPLRVCFRLLLFALSANAVALASYAPMSFFFTLTTSVDGYAFLVLMHVFVLAVAGFASLVANIFVYRAVASELERVPRTGVLAVWGVLYGLVGTQMAWSLRPWVGSPDVPYAFFRPLEGSFAQSVWQLIHRFLDVLT